MRANQKNFWLGALCDEDSRQCSAVFGSDTIR